MTDALEKSGLAPEDWQKLQVRLWALLAERTARYTAGESSSVPLETAQRLMSSLLFTLGVDAGGGPDGMSSLRNENLSEKYDQGLRTIEKKIEIGKKLWQACLMSCPGIENISLRDTLKNIGVFWKRYDYRFFAHEIPCDIDYQLCRFVPDRLLGVDYINAYLRHLLIENELLGKFDCKLVIQLLQHYCPDYKGQLINLYEPVAVNAIGLTLVNGDVRALRLSETEQDKISGMFEAFPKAKAIDTLQRSADALCKGLQIRDPNARHYLRKTAADLYPRIEAALPGGNIGGIFLSYHS
ncbi:MAG: DUF6179 domain-containing protein [Oscillospiraceae bacterium]